MTYREAARRALLVMEANDLPEVVHTFSAAVHSLQAEARERSTDKVWVNTHPITVLLVDKIASLSGTQNLAPQNTKLVMAALGVVMEIANGE